MSTKQDREDAALDALIVLALRGNPDDDFLQWFDEDDFIDPDNLPELTPEEKAAMAAIDIKAIIRKAKA